MTKMQKELAAALAAPRQSIKNDVATTLLGQAGRESTAPVMLQLTQLVRSPYQSRGKRDEAYMDNLVESIRTEGLLDPIIVRPLPEAGGCHTMTPPLPMFELVAGHHRVEAFGILGRAEIPAFVRYLSDAEAARALTSENTVRKSLADWELYKHMAMLRKAGAVPNNTQMARVLNISRTAVVYLESFAVLPQAVHDLLDDHPDLIGYNLAHKLKDYCPQHATWVFDALVLLSQDGLTQAGVPSWIEKKANPREKKPSKDLELGGGVRLVITADGARVTGNIDYDALHQLVEAHLPQLLKSH